MATESSFCIFRNVMIPAGSVISKAEIFFQSHDTLSGIDIDADIYFTDEDDADPPTDKTDLDGRALTGLISWANIADWYDNVVYRTPNLKTILQEVIDRSGWASGNKVMVVLKSVDPPADTYRLWSAEEFLGGSEKACLRASWKEPTQCQTPVFDPSVEFQLATFDCTLRTYPTDASIYYTTDGSTPDENDTLYTTPFEISADTTVKAKAYKEYWEASGIGSKVYAVYVPGAWVLDSEIVQTSTVNTTTGVYVSSVLHMYYTQNNWRFRNVSIPQGAVINSASITLFAYGWPESSDVLTFTLGFQAEDNPSALLTVNEFKAALANTTTLIEWGPDTNWGSFGTPHTTPDMSAALQEIVSRGGWATGQAINFLWTLINPSYISTPPELNFGPLYKSAYGWGPSYANFPTLDVVWSSPSGSGSFKPVDLNTEVRMYQQVHIQG